MERLFKNSRKLLASLGVVAFFMVAGGQFGFGSSQAMFSETEVALENAKEGSWSGSETSCVDIPDSSFGGLGYARICVKQGETYCEWDFYNKFGPSGTGTCYF